MVPFHDSDVAENRWKEGEWRQFELWEKIELRFRRKRFWTVIGVCLLFVALLSIPIIQDRIPKWKALGAMRELAVRINQMKVEASSSRKPLRIRLENTEKGPIFIIDRLTSCPGNESSSSANAEELTRGPVFENEAIAGRYAILFPEDANRIGLERIITSYCYEPALSPSSGPNASLAMGVVPVKDLAEQRLDRIAFLNFSGLSAEIDFD